MAAALAAALLAGGLDATAAEPAPWQVLGAQGLVRYVIVPLSEAKDRAAYQREIARLCEPERPCFLNFHTNSSGAPSAVPLPDAIAAEATATWRQSMKNGVKSFTWSCRLQMPEPNCF